MGKTYDVFDLINRTHHYCTDVAILIWIQHTNTQQILKIHKTRFFDTTWFHNICARYVWTLEMTNDLEMRLEYSDL